MLLFGLGLALASLILIPWSMWYLIRRRDRAPMWALAAWPILGAALAYGFYHAESFSSDDLRVDGFPIPVAFFQLENGRWLDYIGWITPIAMFANPIIGFCLPLVLVAFLTLFRKQPA